MTGHSNVVEEAMQTLNDSGDLLRQVRGIHCTKCGLRRCELLSYRNGIKGMEWWNVWVRAAEALFATVSTRLRCSVRRRRCSCACVCGCVILRLYADRVAEEGCRRGLRDVSELVWEDALVRTTLVTCRFCYSTPPLTLARVYQSVGQTTRHRLRHDLFIPGLNEHLQTLKKAVTGH